MTDPRNWTERELNAYLQRFSKEGGAVETAVSAALSLANLEPAIHGNAKGPDEGQDVHPKFRIHVHSRRRRLADPDGISAKAAIDGLVAGGLLPDDSPAWVESVSYTQEKAEVEETILEVWEILSK